MSSTEVTTIEAALRALTRPAPGSEWDQRIQAIEPPAKRTLRQDIQHAKATIHKATSPRSWKTRSLIKLGAAIYLVGVLTPAYVNHYAPEPKASAATAMSPVSASADPKVPAP